MSKKFVWALILWVVVFGLLLLAISSFNEKHETDFVVNSANYSRRFFVEKSGVEIEAESPYFFVLRNTVMGDVIYGQEVLKPLDWDHPNYFAAYTESASKGEWIIETGRSVKLLFYSQEHVTIPIKFTQEAFAIRAFLAFLLATFVAALLYKLLKNVE